MSIGDHQAFASDQQSGQTYRQHLIAQIAGGIPAYEGYLDDSHTQAAGHVIALADAIIERLDAEQATTTPAPGAHQ